MPHLVSHNRCPEFKSTPETLTRGCSSKWQPMAKHWARSPSSFSPILSPKLQRTSELSAPARKASGFWTPSSTESYHPSCVRWGDQDQVIWVWHSWNVCRATFSSKPWWADKSTLIFSRRLWQLIYFGKTNYFQFHLRRESFRYPRIKVRVLIRCHDIPVLRITVVFKEWNIDIVLIHRLVQSFVCFC